VAFQTVTYLTAITWSLASLISTFFFSEVILSIPLNKYERMLVDLRHEDIRDDTDTQKQVDQGEAIANCQQSSWKDGCSRHNNPTIKGKINKYHQS
jgi:hypothetical protein